MSGVIGATHFLLDANQGAQDQTYNFLNVPPNMWILATCNLTTVVTHADTFAATIAITSYVDEDNKAHNGSWPEVHAQGIQQLTFQIEGVYCHAQGIVMVFFGIEGKPPGITIEQCVTIDDDC
jgi:hypothetical protein